MQTGYSTTAVECEVLKMIKKRSDAKVSHTSVKKGTEYG